MQKVKQRWSKEGKKQQRYKKKREDTAKAKQDDEKMCNLELLKSYIFLKTHSRPEECAKGWHMETDCRPTFVPRESQEGEHGTKIAASWGQEGAKRAKRRLEKRS